LKDPISAPRILRVGFTIVEVALPHYEFLCRDCQKFFDKILALVDYEEGEVICPRCGSKNVEQRWSAVSALASKNSA
jgi:putative FmdB family regulatory protein